MRSHLLHMFETGILSRFPNVACGISDEAVDTPNIDLCHIPVEVSLAGRESKAPNQIGREKIVNHVLKRPLDGTLPKINTECPQKKRKLKNSLLPPSEALMSIIADNKRL
uniref:Uncharacterized protein n=1 Tax=Bracon brevicornis TaxID=1563983 RepID=A0A6V7IRF6_9HYME